MTNSFQLAILMLTNVIFNGNALLLIPESPDVEPNKIVTDILTEASTVHLTEKNPLKSCPVTSQFGILPSLTRNGNWLIKTYDINGRPKNVGGDEFYVTFHDQSNESEHPTAVAIVTDHNNGCYSLKFKSSPMHPELLQNATLNEGGTITIYYSYTCGMSDLPPPEKTNWRHGGFVDKSYQLKVNKSPRIFEFKVPLLPKTVKPYDHILCIGDSMMRHFGGEWGGGKFVRVNGSFTKRFSNPLNSITYENYLLQIRNDIEEEKKRNKKFHRKESASLLVILGSGAWDLVEDNIKSHHGRNVTYFLDKEFSDHKLGIMKLFNRIKEEYSSNHNIQFAWKSNTAAHPHKIPNYEKDALYRSKYTTLARSKRLYDIQKRTTAHYDIPFLDIYEGSYLSAEYHYDTAHFFPIFNEVAWNWFFEIENKESELMNIK